VAVGRGVRVGGKLTQCGGVKIDPSSSRERSPRSVSATSIDGSGPPRSGAARRRAATNRSSETMVSMSRIRGAYVRMQSTALHL
jgi:hypothetical protein